jgi:tetratricopeptide (TPR) repeat protein
LRRSLALKPDSATTHASIASLLASGPDLDEAIVHYRRALVLDPDLPAALVDLAWILATSERPDVRAPEEAVRLAERASERTGNASATVLDTLAVAYAACGRVDLAVATAEQALAAASAAGASELAERIRLRLAAYRQGAGHQPN